MVCYVEGLGPRLECEAECAADTSGRLVNVMIDVCEKERGKGVVLF